MLSVFFSDSVVPISAGVLRARRSPLSRRASLCLNPHFPLYYPYRQAGPHCPVRARLLRPYFTARPTQETN